MLHQISLGLDCRSTVIWLILGQAEMGSGTAITLRESQSIFRLDQRKQQYSIFAFDH
jgi:hypothetical protein